MTTLMFKTDIKNSSDVNQISEFLDRINSIKNWEVDTRHELKTLTVRGMNPDANLIKKAIKKAGFKAEALVEASAHA